MALPSFVTVGAATSSASAATLTPALPASRVNNNILISVCFVKATGKTVTTATTGWTVGDSINSGNTSGAWAWRLVDGTETAAVWTWTGAAACAGQEIQYSGNATVTPINTSNKATGTSTTETIAGLTTTADNCLILDVTTTGGVQTIALGDGFTSRASTPSGNTSIRLSDATISITGTTSAQSMPITSDDWITFGIAIKGTGSGTAPNARVTEVVQEILEQPPLTENNTRVTEVIQEVLEQPPLSENNARVTEVIQEVLEQPPLSENNARVTEVVIQVLRTESIFTAVGFSKGYIIG